MAIGHEAEIGAKFGGGFERDEQGFITLDSMLKFYADWKLSVGDDLLGGWGTLIRSERNGKDTLPRPASARYQGKIPQTEVPLCSLFTSTAREQASAD